VTSIYRRALGDDFERLHPQIKRRFGFSSEDGIASIGRGVMEEIWRGPAFTVPFLVVGTWRRIMFPDRATDVPFTIENYAYRDRFGRETVTWTRTFELARRTRRFDATMIWSERRGCIVDYLGTHQHLAVDLHASHSSSPESRRCASGTTTRPSACGSRSWSRMPASGGSSATAARSRRRSGRARRCPLT
jgi:Domain of unknown function (DUF4166)